MSAKTLSLNISERLASLAVLNSYKGNLDTLATVLEDIRKFVVTEEDWAKADKVETPTENGTNWTWDNDKAGLKDIEVAAETAKFMLSDIERRDAAGEFGIQDKPYITLKEKLK